MSQPPLRFDDGAAYERSMAPWSQAAGRVFLDWLAPAPGLRWIDIGCGNGAFTELIVRDCAPVETRGIDPSAAQIAYARGRAGVAGAVFGEGDAMALPFDDARFDAAVMALVIFFVPEPARGVAEAARVVRRGGLVAAYAWDMAGGGFPFHPVHAALRALGIVPPGPPSPDAGSLAGLAALWRGAGLEAVATRTIAVRRVFPRFEDFWESATNGATMRKVLAGLSAAEIGRVTAHVRGGLETDGAGRLVCHARANAIRGRVG